MKIHLDFQPATAERWPDLVELFGETGACGGCWCMYWRQTASEFEKQKGAGNKRAMKRLLLAGEFPGIIAYDGDKPIGWCSVAPRERFPRLVRSRTLKPIDDKPVWSIVCLFIAREYRKNGLSSRLIEAAVKFVKSQGGKLVEGYPVVPKRAKWADAFLYTGVPSSFRRAGFRQVAEPSASRLIVRRVIRG
jgi:GNAT superfamily N-acetyltransferase